MDKFSEDSELRYRTLFHLFKITEYGIPPITLKEYITKESIIQHIINIVVYVSKPAHSFVYNNNTHIIDSCNINEIENYINEKIKYTTKRIRIIDIQNFYNVVVFIL